MRWSVLIATMILSAIFLLSTGRSGNITPLPLAEKIVHNPVNYHLESIEPSFNQQVKEAIYHLSSPAFLRAGLRFDKNDILDEVEQLGNASDILSLTPDTLTGENKKLATRLKSILSSIQSTDFPVLRKNYLAWLSHSLSNQHIEIESSEQVIVFEGVRFAERQQVESYNRQLIKDLEKLRFRKVMYKFIRNDDNPACFELSDASDTDISYNAYH